MYTGDYKMRLKDSVRIIDDRKYVPLDEVEEILEEIGSKVVSWDVDDFEAQAKEKEQEEMDSLVIYDRSKFKEALERMIDKHDATIGINWETVDYYLNEYCKLGIPYIPVKYTSEWDNGVSITTDACYDPEENDVFDIETSETKVDGVCIREYITFPDGKVLEKDQFTVEGGEE